MQYLQGTAIGTTEQGYCDFRVPRDHYVACVQIQDEHTYPIYVRVEYYNSEGDEFPAILFCDWVRSNSTYYNIPAIALNFPIDSEKGILRVNMLNETGSDITPKVHIQYYNKPTNMVGHYEPEVHRGIWALDAKYERHTSAGVIDIVITPAPGSWIELMSFSLQAGFTGAEDVEVDYHDENDSVIEIIIVDNTTTGTLRGHYKQNHVSTVVATTPETIGKSENVTRVTYPDHIHIATSAVPATDDVEIRIRARLKDQIPTITLGTNVQVQGGYADAYNKVI